MPEPKQPKKETVRIALPSTRVEAPGADDDTAGIDFPARNREAEAPELSPFRSSALSQPAAQSRRIVPPPPPVAGPKYASATASVPQISPPVSAPPTPVAKTPMPGPPAAGATVMEAAMPDLAGPTSGAPKKETSRINLVPDSPKSADMRKTQPLVTLTDTPVRPPPPLNITSAARPSSISSIPMGLCWALVAVSALILLIEIWNYIS
jgi:hypothetical protein